MSKAGDSSGGGAGSQSGGQKCPNDPQGVIVKPGQKEIRFGPVVTGRVALGKDGCGY